MNKEDTSSEQPRLQWFIDVDWFPQNGRSFTALARSCLCPTCHERMKVEPGKTAANDLIGRIRDCCSKTTGFICAEQPVYESIFRLFLANGNQALDLEELSRQLNERRGGDSYRTSTETLFRLLEHDQYYGLRRVQD